MCAAYYPAVSESQQERTVKARNVTPWSAVTVALGCRDTLTNRSRDSGRHTSKSWRPPCEVRPAAPPPSPTLCHEILAPAIIGARPASLRGGTCVLEVGVTAPKFASGLRYIGPHKPCRIQRLSAPRPLPPLPAPFTLRGLSKLDAQASSRAPLPLLLLPPTGLAAQGSSAPGAPMCSAEACHDCQLCQCSSTTLTTALQATPSSCAPRPSSAAAPQHLSLRPWFHVTLQAHPGYNT